MMATKEKVALPEHLKTPMYLYSNGIKSMPQGFIDFHKGLAELELLDVHAAGYTIHKSWMDSDGWGIMQVLHAIVEHEATHKLIKLQWHDGNQGFMEQMPSGGWGIFDY